MPNERDDASTVKLEVNLPTDHPLASVMPQPVPGWKVKVTKTKLDKPLEMHGEKINEAPSKITWTADGKGVEPGQFQQFPVSVGQLPEDADQLVFKALQTYDNKEVVRWIEPAKEGGPEPENPAPVLKLTAATGDGHGHGAACRGRRRQEHRGRRQAHRGRRGRVRQRHHGTRAGRRRHRRRHHRGRLRRLRRPAPQRLTTRPGRRLTRAGPAPLPLEPHGNYLQCVEGPCSRPPSRRPQPSP